MTREEIMKMEAGPELDALIAEKVMGWKWSVYECQCPSLNDGRCIKQNGMVTFFMPSRDISSAWQVVEKMQTDGFWFCLYKAPEALNAVWHVEIGGFKTWADTAPLAICRAALLTTQAAEK